ncbi:MAG: glycine zipper 2TM domain-containing protein [Steroidobacteraceae bacterium]
MHTKLKSIARSTVIGLGLVAASVASAHPPEWSNSRWNRDSYNSRNAYRSTYQVVRAPVVQYDYARVVDVDPIIRRVAVSSPQRDCWYEDREVVVQRSATPTVLGAIIGGVIGHNITNGSSRGVATVAGAVLGASVGNDAAARNGRVQTQTVQQCETRYSRDFDQRIDGYRVTYRYEGREYNTVMAYDPGNRVQVRVGVDVDVVR